jgi:hypothetical protein
MSDFSKTSFYENIRQDYFPDCSSELSANLDFSEKQHHMQVNSGEPAPVNRGVTSMLTRTLYTFMLPRRGCIIHTKRRRINFIINSNSKIYSYD